MMRVIHTGRQGLVVKSAHFYTLVQSQLWARTSVGERSSGSVFIPPLPVTGDGSRGNGGGGGIRDAPVYESVCLSARLSHFLI